MERTWWKEAVVYQVYWRSFYDSDGDGYGDLRGVIEKLDYIKKLGVSVIWLNPFYESPDKDNGYDISDYYSVMDKAGTMEDFEELLSEAHKRDLKVIMDLVVNHTSDQHQWFLESKSSRDNPKRDWYIWRDPVNRREPNNWRSYFTPSTWEYDETTGQYYFHSFAVEQPDLNWENKEVREAIYEMMRFWLDKGIDGFRMDVINLLAKIDGFPDADDPEYTDYLANNPGIHEYLKEMNEKVLRYYDILTVGEIPFVTPEEGLEYVAEDRNELKTLFHFEVADDMPTWDMVRYKEIQEKWHNVFYGKGWNSQFLNNHDHTRQVTRYGNDNKYRKESSKLLATMIHTLPGIPYVFQGEEIGMTGVRFDTIDEYNDIAMKNKYREEVQKGRNPVEVFESLLPLSRDNSRTPIQWDETEQAGFTKGEPWINVNPNYEMINVERELSEEDSIFSYYQQLIALRKENPVMIYGDYTDLSKGQEKLYVYTRQFEGTRWLIILNCSDDHTIFDIDVSVDDSKQKLMLANYSDVTGEEVLKDTSLRPHEARIYEI